MYRKQVFKQSLIQLVDSTKQLAEQEQQRVGEGVWMADVEEEGGGGAQFTPEELSAVFELQDYTDSRTQRELAALYPPHLRRSYRELDEHIVDLHRRGIFGVTDHDLLFDVRANANRLPLPASEQADEAAVRSRAAAAAVHATQRAEAMTARMQQFVPHQPARPSIRQRNHNGDDKELLREDKAEKAGQEEEKEEWREAVRREEREEDQTAEWIDEEDGTAEEEEGDDHDGAEAQQDKVEEKVHAPLNTVDEAVRGEGLGTRHDSDADTAGASEVEGGGDERVGASVSEMRQWVHSAAHSCEANSAQTAVEAGHQPGQARDREEDPPAAYDDEEKQRQQHQQQLSSKRVREEEKEEEEASGNNDQQQAEDVENKAHRVMERLWEDDGGEEEGAVNTAAAIIGGSGMNNENDHTAGEESEDSPNSEDERQATGRDGEEDEVERGTSSAASSQSVNIAVDSDGMNAAPSEVAAVDSSKVRAQDDEVDDNSAAAMDDNPHPPVHEPTDTDDADESNADDELNCRDEGEEAVEYEAEDVTDMRQRNGRVEYRVRWQGYGAEHDLWQAELRCYCTTCYANLSFPACVKFIRCPLCRTIVNTQFAQPAPITPLPSPPAFIPQQLQQPHSSLTCPQCGTVFSQPPSSLTIQCPRCRLFIHQAATFTVMHDRQPISGCDGEARVDNEGQEPEEVEIQSAMRAEQQQQTGGDVGETSGEQTQAQAQAQAHEDDERMMDDEAVEAGEGEEQRDEEEEKEEEAEEVEREETEPDTETAESEQDVYTEADHHSGEDEDDVVSADALTAGMDQLALDESNIAETTEDAALSEDEALCQDESSEQIAWDEAVECAADSIILPSTPPTAASAVDEAGTPVPLDVLASVAALMRDDNPLSHNHQPHDDYGAQTLAQPSPSCTQPLPSRSLDADRCLHPIRAAAQLILAALHLPSPSPPPPAAAAAPCRCCCCPLRDLIHWLPELSVVDTGDAVELLTQSLLAAAPTRGAGLGRRHGDHVRA